MHVLKYSIALQLNYLETFFPKHIVMTPIIFSDMQGWLIWVQQVRENMFIQRRKLN
jgi:hypothetical protein